MSPTDRYVWILEYLRKRSTPQARDSVDVLNAYFVDGYVDHTNAKCAVMPFGAHKCPQLGRDLSAMHRDGLLERRATGLEGMAGMGFPRWVYTYRLGLDDISPKPVAEGPSRA